MIDWFLLAGPNVIYRLSLAMLRTWRRDLLALDFEGSFFLIIWNNLFLPRPWLNLNDPNFSDFDEL